MLVDCEVVISDVFIIRSVAYFTLYILRKAIVLSKGRLSSYPEWMAIKQTLITISGLERELLKQYAKISPLVLVRSKVQALAKLESSLLKDSVISRSVRFL